MNEEYVIIDKTIRFHNTPLPEVKINSPSVLLFVDKPNEERFQIEFSPYQAARIITVDCFDLGLISSDESISMTIYEVLNSKWIKQLKIELKGNDEGANFLDKSKHFMMPLQDDFLEVVAWEYNINENIE